MTAGLARVNLEISSVRISNFSSSHGVSWVTRTAIGSVRLDAVRFEDTATTISLLYLEDYGATSRAQTVIGNKRSGLGDAPRLGSWSTCCKLAQLLHTFFFFFA
jgi:hypothetical protein